MPAVKSILADLKAKGSENVRKIYSRHGMSSDRVYGVKVADIKLAAKSIKGQQPLACQLFETGNMEAMYLAGLVADGAKLSPSQLDAWLEAAADLQMIAEYTIPWLAVEHPQARQLALKWIDSKAEHVAAAGWCTYGGIVAVRPDSDLDLNEIRELLDRVVRNIDAAPNRARHCMNNFVIAVGSYVLPLLNEAKAAAMKIGAVRVDMGDTACKIPMAVAYIERVESMGRIGKKRKTMRC